MLEQARTKFIEVCETQIEELKDDTVRYHSNVSIQSVEKMRDKLKALDINHYSARSILASAQTDLNLNTTRISNAKESIERYEGSETTDFQYEAKSQSPVPPVSDKELEAWRHTAKVVAHDPYNEPEE